MLYTLCTFLNILVLHILILICNNNTHRDEEYNKNCHAAAIPVLYLFRSIYIDILKNMTTA